MKDVYACGLDNFRYYVADIVENALIPLHRRAGWQQVCKSIYGTELLYAVGRCPVYACYGTKWCFYITVAWGLSAPGATIYIRCAINNPHYRAVIVHKVTSWQMSEP